MRRIIRGLLPAFNALMSPLAGRRSFGYAALLRHRGRRSGTWYATPVTVRPAPGGLVIALTWGEQADWCRNVRAAQGCDLRWKGADYALVEPRVVDAVSALPSFSALERVVLRRLGIASFLRLDFRTV